MAGIYGGEDDAAVNEDEEDADKPAWDDDIDITDIVPASLKSKKKKDKKRDQDNEDGDGVDVDAIDEDQVDTFKPKGKNKVVDLDELYELDFTDMIGDMPTRFKYTPVLPQTYGMDPVEMLLADDADLNNVVGLRALAPYRRDKGRTWDPHRVTKLQEFRKKLQSKRGYVADGGHERNKCEPQTKRRGKKERLKSKLAETAMVQEDVPSTVAAEVRPVEDGDATPSKKRKRRHKKASAAVS